MSRTTEPTILTQGERIEWTRTFTDYPANEWTVQYRFRGDSQGFNVDATANGTDHVAVIAAAASPVVPGRYIWQAFATSVADPDDIRCLDSGELMVRRGFSSDTSAVDLRSDAKRTLDAINAAIRDTATRNHSMYRVQTSAGEQEIRRLTLVDLMAAQKVYSAIVARENAAANSRRTGRFGESIKVRMYDD